MGVLIFFVLVAELVVAYFIAKEFEKIAIMKGHTEKRYFWWSFLFGIAGWPMVIALPDRSDKTLSGNAGKENKPAEDEIPDI